MTPPPTLIRHTFSPFVNVRQARYVQITDEIPADVLVVWAAKLYTLTNLSWQYIDTILDIVVQMKIRQTRPLVKTVREIRLEYDRFRARSIDGAQVSHETDLAESFEEWLEKDLKKLFYALDFEVSKMDIVKSQRPLVIATYQAVTLMEAVRAYARKRDREISGTYGITVKDCCLIQNEYLRLYPLIPQFAGDCYTKDLPAVRTTANIIANKMEESIINVLPDKEEQ